MSVVRIAGIYLSLLGVALGCGQQQLAGQEPEAPGVQFPASQTMPSKNIVMIGGTENNTAMVGTSIGDVFIKNRLELDMGHTVTIVPEGATAEEMLAAANAADLVIVPESVTSGRVGTKIVATPTPILSYEAFLQDQFGLVDPAGRPVDPGTPDAGAFGAIEDQMYLNIVNSDHPLAAGLDGRVQVYRFPRQVNWGKDRAPGAEVIATLPDFPQGAAIYLIRRGAPLFDGSPAPGLRIHYFIENDNSTGSANLMTHYGLRLFDAAVNYALTTDLAR
jgi:hypothetical protein